MISSPLGLWRQLSSEPMTFSASVRRCWRLSPLRPSCPRRSCTTPRALILPQGQNQLRTSYRPGTIIFYFSKVYLVKGQGSGLTGDRDYYDNSGNDQAFINFDLKADLSPLFNWNVKVIAMFWQVSNWPEPNICRHSTCTWLLNI